MKTSQLNFIFDWLVLYYQLNVRIKEQLLSISRNTKSVFSKMMNYIYSVFKRSNTNASTGETSLLFIQYVLVTIFAYVILTYTGLLFIEDLFFENGNGGYELFVGLACAFIVLFPIIYAITPGYKYLDHVKEYSTLKAIIISSLIGLLPIVFAWVFMYVF